MANNYYQVESDTNKMELIIKRYNVSVSDYVEYKHCLLTQNSEEAKKNLRYAAEEMSECLEYAVRLHFKKCDPDRWKYHKKDSAPNIIKNYYWDINNNVSKEDAIETRKGKTTTVDFAYLCTNKNLLINNEKHNWKEISPQVYERYMVEVKKFIIEFLDDEADLKDENYFDKPSFDNIQAFYAACKRFEKKERKFILVVDSSFGNQALYRNFSKVNWDVIVDFNANTFEGGLLGKAYSNNTPTHIFTTLDNISDDNIPSNSTNPIVLLANGYNAMNIKSAFDAKDWAKKYKKKVSGFFEHYKDVNIAQETIVVSLLQDQKYIDHMINILYENVDGLSFVVANDVNNYLESFCNNHMYKELITHLQISLGEIDTCLTDYLFTSQGNNSQCFKLPCLSKEVDGIFSQKEMAELQEYFDVLYEGVDVEINGVEEDFLSGSTILTWEGAKRDFAVENPKMKRNFYRTIDEEIRKGKGKLTIVHEPGFGGTTIARQIAYHYHEENPVLFMKQYNLQKIKTLLRMVHNHTKKTILVFMEIPSVISQDDMNSLFNGTNQAQPYLFIGIKRGTPKVSPGELAVNDWGDNVIKLKDKFIPYIKRFSDDQRKEKEDEINKILLGVDKNPYKRTPFYFGFLAFEDKFMAMNSFLEHFVTAISNNDAQRKALIYIAIVDKYAGRGLPDSFLKIVFNVDQTKNVIFHLEDYFKDDDGVINSLLISDSENGATYRKLKYPYFGKLLLEMLLNNGSVSRSTGAIFNLGSYCKSLIEDVAISMHKDRFQDEILKNLFIGTSQERTGNRFTNILADIQKEERINIFLLLHERFPENPHFASHLARFYAFEEKNYEEALHYADKAISLSPAPDALLHNIKGMCLFEVIKYKCEEIENLMKRGTEVPRDIIDEVVYNLFADASNEFKLYRQLFNKKDEYGYLPNIRMILKVFDIFVKVNGKTKSEVISNAESPYIDWIDDANALLEDVKSIYIEGEESEYYTREEARVWEQFENFGQLINNLNNKLEKGINSKFVRRQISRIYIRRDPYFRNEIKNLRRVLTLMEDNINLEPDNEQNYFLWFAAARYSDLKIGELISKASAWRGVNPSIEITFICYILHVVNAFNGSTESAAIALNFEKECKALGKDDIKVREWYGDNPHDLIANKDFCEDRDPERLYVVRGYVSDYQHDGAAYITSSKTGLKVFFRPTENNLTESCKNHEVEFSFGFSYDGLRALGGTVKVVD